MFHGSSWSEATFKGLRRLSERFLLLVLPAAWFVSPVGMLLPSAAHLHFFLDIWRVTRSCSALLFPFIYESQVNSPLRSRTTNRAKSILRLKEGILRRLLFLQPRSGLANCRSQDKSGPSSVCVNKILLEHRHAPLCLWLLHHNGKVEKAWQFTKLKILIFWLLVENVCGPPNH